MTETPKTAQETADTLLKAAMTDYIGAIIHILEPYGRSQLDATILFEALEAERGEFLRRRAEAISILWKGKK